MATIKILEPRAQDAHFGLYRTSVGGVEGIFVRRKVGDPTDYMHTKSRKLQRQRRSFALASQNYARLTPSQKAITKHQFEFVEYQQSHGKTDTKLLMGRQLFIAKEIRSLNVTQTPQRLPLEFCIMLVDEALNPLAGELWLFYLEDGQWHDCTKEELASGNWLFSKVPVGKEAYRVYGESAGYVDPILPEAQDMTAEELRLYHYHVLLFAVDYEDIDPSGDTDLIELLPYGETHFTKLLHLDTIFHDPGEGPGFGWYEGERIWKSWYPWGYKSDLFHFASPVYAAQYIHKVVFHSYIGSCLYPWGLHKLILKTHGVIYESEPYHCTVRFRWKLWEFPLNPHTNESWTRDEILALQAGMSMDKVGSFGVIMCDRLFARLHYTPA